MSELVPHERFPDVLTGEVLPATPANAHKALTAVKEMEAKLRMVKAAVLDYIIEESRRQGTKTFNVDGGKIELSGGPSTEIDGQSLAQLLLDAGMPQDRVSEIVIEEISYKVNRAKLKQATSANPDYQAAAELCTHEVEKPWRASAK